MHARRAREFVQIRAAWEYCSNGCVKSPAIRAFTQLYAGTPRLGFCASVLHPLARLSCLARVLGR